MHPRRHPRRFGLLLALALLGLAVAALWPRPSAICPENAARLRPGLTLAEVEDALGGPARNETDLPDHFIRDAFVAGSWGGPRPANERRWASPGYVVVVEFDEADRVLRHTPFTFQVDRSFFDQLRRWLHL